MGKLKNLRDSISAKYKLLFWPHCLAPAPFLKNIRDDLEAELASAPEVVFCFWTGTNEMSRNRIRCLESMRGKCGVPVQLITSLNLNEWIVSDHPLPEGFEFLSCVHKADYLRSYFMYHYGGGYSDIKYCNNSWLQAFGLLNSNPSKVGLGYSEISPSAVAAIRPSKLLSKRDIFYFNYKMKESFKSLIGNGAYIFKPKSLIFKALLLEQERRIKDLLGELRKNPGNEYGNNPGYPVPWTYLLGEIFHPIVFLRTGDLIIDDSIKPSFLNYR